SAGGGDAPGARGRIVAASESGEHLRALRQQLLRAGADDGRGSEDSAALGTCIGGGTALGAGTAAYLDRRRSDGHGAPVGPLRGGPDSGTGTGSCLRHGVAGQWRGVRVS